MYRPYSWESALAGSLIGMVMLLAIVIVLVAVWLMVQLVRLLVRVAIRHGGNTLLRGMLVVFLLLLVVALITNGQVATINVLAGICVLLLLGLALVLDIADEVRVREPISRDGTIHAVLHNWWGDAA